MSYFYKFTRKYFSNQSFVLLSRKRIKEWLKIIKPFKLLPLEEVPLDTIEICKKFDEKYKSKCSNDIVKNQR